MNSKENAPLRSDPRIVEVVRKLRLRSVLIDGEGVVCTPDGLADFDLLHGGRNDDRVTLAAFDLHDGDDVRLRALGERKEDQLRKLLAKVKEGIQFNAHVEGDGPTVFQHACKLGCGGIIAKRIDLPYQSGRSKRWLKIKNPESPAARRADEGTI